MGFNLLAFFKCLVNGLLLEGITDIAARINSSNDSLSECFLCRASYMSILCNIHDQMTFSTFTVFGPFNNLSCAVSSLIYSAMLFLDSFFTCIHILYRFQ